MKRLIRNTMLLLIVMCFACKSQQQENVIISDKFNVPQEASKPWVYWYWMHSAYSKEGITADLEAMKDIGIGGAYLMSIKGPTDPPLIDPPIIQLSKSWWDMVRFAMEEANRLDIKLAMHASDGFAVAGGPWITPDNSMKKVVWSDTIVQGGSKVKMLLPMPDTLENYYKDIATFAIPLKDAQPFTVPKVTTSLDENDVQFLVDEGMNGRLKFRDIGWFQYEYDKPFTCRSIKIVPDGNSYQAHRLKILTSENGIDFDTIAQLKPPRHGWQDGDAPYTHSIKPVTSRFFKFVYDPKGTEPGSEDLDAAKWSATLKIKNVLLSSDAKINQFEGKSAAVWRIASASNDSDIPPESCVKISDLINVTEFLEPSGKLNWDAPKGTFKILRMGQTSTGHTNYTGGGGLGLEVDKFDPYAIRFQFDQWFGEAVRTAGPELAKNVLKVLHIDSWECGSQNWSNIFQKEFEARRGYDIVDYLPVMAGIPLKSAEFSEQLLYDVRKTITELLTENFFGTMAEEAKNVGVDFSSENVAPTMVSDALLHFKYVDFPAGEFWLNSPTHDKPNDILDAISAGHIYGKNVIQAEAFTELRMDWNEHPGNLKTLGDLHYALGVNRFFYHVFVHNPWTDRKPGMTLDNVGTYIQRDQTWWEHGKAWIDYTKRVQNILQQGHPVVDLAVFTGEELPSRALLPDRLMSLMPNVFGSDRQRLESDRLLNINQPTAKMPKEVTYAKNITGAKDWVNALNGYHYDSFNSDVLLNDAKVVDGSVKFKGPIAYKALLIPGQRKMNPNNVMSLATLKKLIQLVLDGATIFLQDRPSRSPGLLDDKAKEEWSLAVDSLWPNVKSQTTKALVRTFGKGRILQLPYWESDFSSIDIEPDVMFTSVDANKNVNLAWNHRVDDEQDIYFLSNQQGDTITLHASFRIRNKQPYLYHPISNELKALPKWTFTDGRINLPLKFEKNESYFIIFKNSSKDVVVANSNNWDDFANEKTISGKWNVKFDPKHMGPSETQESDILFDWSSSDINGIKYYSGTAIYSINFDYSGNDTSNIWLDLGKVENIAKVTLNGTDCGILWTFPFRCDISKSLNKGNNILKIELTNTWANRLIGDQMLPESERMTWTTSKFRLEKNALLPAGLMGPVQLLRMKK